MALAQLLAGPTAALPPAAGVNGLLDCQGTPEEAAAEAAALLQQQPYAALKIKVGRRADPLADAAAVLAIRQAVGPEVVLRADANRRWALEQAVQVCVCVHASCGRVPAVPDECLLGWLQPLSHPFCRACLRRPSV